MPATDEAVQLAVVAADAADDRKASDLLILEVADILAVVDVFLLASTSSDRQLKAVVDRIEERLREDADRKPLRREGTAASGWMLLDFGDLVCHVFSTEQRAHYALERLWADVPRREVRSGDQLPPVAPGLATGREDEAAVVPGDVAGAGWLDVPDEADLDDTLADLDDDEVAALEAGLGDAEPDAGLGDADERRRRGSGT